GRLAPILVVLREERGRGIDDLLLVRGVDARSRRRGDRLLVAPHDRRGHDADDEDVCMKNHRKFLYVPTQSNLPDGPHMCCSVSVTNRSTRSQSIVATIAGQT